MNHYANKSKARKKLKLVKTAITAAILGLSTSANAVFDFSNISLTENSVTFTIDGDMSGYTAPTDTWYIDQFSIGYEGDFFIFSGGHSANNWSPAIFDNKTTRYIGNTVSGSVQYSWTKFNESLVDAMATNRTVTLSLTDTIFDLNGFGDITFNWGNPNRGSDKYTELARFEIAPVPEPSMH